MKKSKQAFVLVVLETDEKKTSMKSENVRKGTSVNTHFHIKKHIILGTFV